jgi:hypothetical protein
MSFVGDTLDNNKANGVGSDTMFPFYENYGRDICDLSFPRHK